MKKRSLAELLACLEPERRKLARSIIAMFSQTFFLLPGSTTKHQAWPGGYVHHLEETMNIASVLYDTLHSLRPLPFSKTDAQFTLFLHDADKLFSYVTSEHGTLRTQSHADAQHAFFSTLRTSWHYTLSNEEENALRYVHGEGNDYHPTNRVMQPLAAFIHSCDVISARIWYDKGRDSSSWTL